MSVILLRIAVRVESVDSCFGTQAGVRRIKGQPVLVMAMRASGEVLTIVGTCLDPGNQPSLADKAPFQARCQAGVQPITDLRTAHVEKERRVSLTDPRVNTPKKPPVLGLLKREYLVGPEQYAAVVPWQTGIASAEYLQ